MVESLVLPVAVSVLTGGLQQTQRAHYIGAGKGEGIFYGAVYVAFGGQVNDTVDIVFLYEGAHAAVVADVGLHESVVRLVLNVHEVGEVAGIGECIQIDDVVLRVFGDKKTHNVRTDETCTSGNENVFHKGWKGVEKKRRLHSHVTAFMLEGGLEPPRVSPLDP